MNSKHNKLKPAHSIHGSVFWHLLILRHIHLEPIKLGCSLAAEVGSEAGALAEAFPTLTALGRFLSGFFGVKQEL